MKFCKECNVKIITPVSKCPLCKATTIYVDGPEVRAYPDLYSEQVQTSVYTGLINVVKKKQIVPT